MPRFKTLSDVIANQIRQTVPDIHFPDGSATNIQIGRIPLPQDYNLIKNNKDFRWGESVGDSILLHHNIKTANK